MTAPSSPPEAFDLRRRVSIETPENVVLALEVAGLGSRAMAALVDALILAMWLLAAGMLSSLLRNLVGGGSLLAALTILVSLVSILGYFIGFEAFAAGRTPGKRALGIRVVLDTGHPLTLGAAVVRTLLRLADIFPPPSYLVGALFVAFHPEGKRLGDIVAGTIVVRDRPHEGMVLEDAAASQDALGELGTPELTDEEFTLLRQFHERLPSLDRPVRRKFAAQLVARLVDDPARDADDMSALRRLYHQELRRRRGRLAARGAARPGGVTGGGGSLAERFVARKLARWREFDALALRAARGGLNAMDGETLLVFASRYREIAADLARAQTYRASSRVIRQLERSVSAGHTILYQEARQPFRRLWAVVARECPAAVISAWRYVVIGFLLFALPGAGGYLLIRDRPALASELLPDTMLERAEVGQARVEIGAKYFEATPGSRPFIATFIISNNVRIAFMCFAGGVFLGIGSLVLLAYNGLAIGTISGHFANVGLLGYLLEFIVGHGVLELFAIWVAGAAGFLLGKSIIAPGRLTRSDALVLNGRLALRMVGAATVLLLLAGLIEGFVSAGAQDLVTRFVVSGASVLLLAGYLVYGAHHRAALDVAIRGDVEVSGAGTRAGSGESVG